MEQELIGIKITLQNENSKKNHNILAFFPEISYILTSKIKHKDKIIMSVFATTKLSSKGQVVIPEEIREELGLKTGSQFIVVGDKDVVILKTISPPSIDEFEDLVKKARKDAKKAGLKKKEIDDIIEKVRSKS
jgi:AbrB family looped-hinge helix DNA binding protein